jgi:hypothetical protein
MLGLLSSQSIFVEKILDWSISNDVLAPLINLRSKCIVLSCLVIRRIVEINLSLRSIHYSLDVLLLSLGSDLIESVVDRALSSIFNHILTLLADLRMINLICFGVLFLILDHVSLHGYIFLILLLVFQVLVPVSSLIWSGVDLGLECALFHFFLFIFFLKQLNFLSLVLFEFLKSLICSLLHFSSHHLLLLHLVVLLFVIKHINDLRVVVMSNLLYKLFICVSEVSSLLRVSDFANFLSGFLNNLFDFASFMSIRLVHLLVSTFRSLVLLIVLSLF